MRMIECKILDCRTVYETRLSPFSERILSWFPTAIAAIATVNRQICPKVFKLDTDLMFLTEAFSRLRFLNLELYLSDSVLFE